MTKVLVFVKPITYDGGNRRALRGGIAACNAVYILPQIYSVPAGLLALGFHHGSIVMDQTPAAATTPPKSTVTNVIDDPTVSLQRFDLLDLQPYTQKRSTRPPPARTFICFMSDATTSTISSNTFCRGSASPST